MERYHPQFIGLEKHDREGSLVGAFAALGVIRPNGSISLHSRHRTRVKKTLGKKLIITDDGRPWRETPETSEVVLAGLRIELQHAILRLPSVRVGLVFRDTSRLAFRASTLRGRCGRSVGRGGGFRLGRVSGTLLRFLRVGSLRRRAWLLSRYLSGFFLFLLGICFLF